MKNYKFTWVFLIILGLGLLSWASSKVEVNYKVSEFELFNDGHAISIKPKDERNFVKFNDEKYILRDIRINFKDNQPIEIDFIHYNPHEVEGKDLLVIRAYIEVSPDAKPNPTMERIIKTLSPHINDKKTIRLNPRSLLPANIDYKFVKSLPITTPLPDNALGLVLINTIKITLDEKRRLAAKFNERFANTPQP